LRYSVLDSLLTVFDCYAPQVIHSTDSSKALSLRSVAFEETVPFHPNLTAKLLHFTQNVRAKALHPDIVPQIRLVATICALVVNADTDTVLHTVHAECFKSYRFFSYC
jgi:hypothetical protein